MIGKTVSHYRITKKLGAGGMGVVYEAVDTKLDRVVALKFLAPELSRDPLAKERFTNEARAASSLEHGAICTIHEIDETEDGQLFLVMPCYEGETLRERMGGGPLPVEEATHIILQISRGLAKAHEQGLVHRDIKPENIFLTIDGEVRLLDFGLAKLAGATRLTLPGTTMGTPGYLSPEQAGGNEAGASSDVWALGIVLREMVLGRPVFAGDHPQAILYAIQNVEPDPIPADVADFYPDLQMILDRCLQKDPSRRFQNAGELVSALGKRATPVKPAFRRLWIPSLAAFLLIFVGVISMWQPWQQRETRTGESPGINWILVADFEGPEDDPGLAVATRELITAGLERSSFVTPVSRDALKRGLRLAGLPDSTVVSGPVARQLADRAGAGAYVTGRIDRLPGGYIFILRVRDPETNNLITSLQDQAKGEGDFLRILDRLSHRLRETLGESLDEVQATRQPLEVITSSYPAFRALVRATALHRKGENIAALHESKQALKLDPEFASAWSMAAVCYANLGQKESSKLAMEEALARPERLTESQLRRLEVWYQEFVNHDLEGALLPGRLLVELEPNAASHNILGMVYHQSGDFEAAVKEFTKAVEVSVFLPSYAVLSNLTADLITLGRFEEAEAYFAELPDNWRQHRTLDLLLAKKEWEGVAGFAQQLREDPETDGSVWLWSSAALASLDILQGAAVSGASKFQECRQESWGIYIPVLEFAQDRLFLATGRVPNLRPRPVMADSTMAGLVLAGLRAVSLGDVGRAEDVFESIKKLPDSEQRRYATDICYFEAVLARERNDWASVKEILEPLTYRGRLPVFVCRIPIRFMVAEAWEELGHPEEAATAYEAVLDPTWVAEYGASLELTLWGIEYPFALYRCAGLMDRLGQKEKAEERYVEFLGLFHDPDPIFAHLVTDARSSLDHLRGK